MQTEHKIVIGSSQQMPELNDDSVQLMVTSPPYPMLKMWDDLFSKADPEIARIWQKLEGDCQEETVMQIYGECMITCLGFGRKPTESLLTKE